MLRLPMAVLLFTMGVVILDTPKVHAANKCIQVLRQGNIETLVNRCAQCKIATLMRARPGGAKPVTRQFKVFAKSTFPVPFKGSGRSRIKSERLCPSERGAKNNSPTKGQHKSGDGERCVSLEQNAGSGVMLVNRCGKCRAAAIERSTNGQNGASRDYIKIDAGGRTIVPSKGYSTVGLLAEIACP